MNNDGKKLNKIIFIILTVLIFILVIVVFGLAYAKYATAKQGGAVAKVGNMICKLEVNACSNEEKSIVNPYCDVTVKSFNEENGSKETTDTSINYKIKVVSPNGEGELPKYYWVKDDSDEKIAGTVEGIGNDAKADLYGTFTKGDSTEHKYKIVFVNTGETDVTKSIQFQLTATQANVEKEQ